MSRRPTLAEADAGLQRQIDLLNAELRHTRPDYYLADGTLDWRRVSNLLIERFGGRRYLTEQDIRSLDSRGVVCHVVTEPIEGQQHYCYERPAHDGQHHCPCGFDWQPEARTTPGQPNVGESR